MNQDYEYTYQLENERPSFTENESNSIMSELFAKRSSVLPQDARTIVIADRENYSNRENTEGARSNSSREYIENLIEMRKNQLSDPREVVLALSENTDFPAQAREVLKEEKIERKKDVSRSSCEEKENLASPGSEEEPQQVKSQSLTSVSGNETGAPETEIEKTFTGITVQQNKTKSGIKLSVTLQTENDAKFGAGVKLTAELKRADRVRELKSYAADDSYFDEFLQNTKQSIRDLDSESKKLVCIGRVHNSGVREAWYPNLLVIGTMNVVGVVAKVQLFYEAEFYEIDMNVPMSSSQDNYYVANGIYGTLIRKTQVPTIATAKRVLL